MIPSTNNKSDYPQCWLNSELTSTQSVSDNVYVLFDLHLEYITSVFYTYRETIKIVYSTGQEQTQYNQVCYVRDRACFVGLYGEIIPSLKLGVY